MSRRFQMIAVSSFRARERRGAYHTALIVALFLVALFAAGSAEAEEGGQFPSASPEVTERVRLRKAGERCEPVMREWIAVPGHDMLAGSFELYVAAPRSGGCFKDKGMDGRIKEVCREPYTAEEKSESAGVLVGGETIHYPAGNHWTGEMNFGFHKDYLVMDAWPYGASHGRMMFLYRLKDDGVDLLDAVGEGLFSDFSSARISEFQTTEYGHSGLMEVADVDGDGNPEIKLSVFQGERFHIYVEIRDGRLRVDLNPALYKRLFDEAKRGGLGRETRAYYIYGFLSGELKPDEIMRAISGDERRVKRHRGTMELIGTVDKWDESFHGDAKFSMTKYDLKGAKCDE